MRDYKADITLNEQDSLNDLLIAEKGLTKLYATVITESVSKGVRNVVRQNLIKEIDDQISVFFLLTEMDYARVVSASEELRKDAREKFKKAKKEVEEC